MSIQVPEGARLLVEAHLKPVQGSRFQPTGFPDLGAATYRLPDGTEMLLVESAQSVANRLEAVCWDEGEQRLHKALAGMPFVSVNHEGRSLTNSLLEAHRLNSAYIEKSDGFESIKTEIGHDEDKPVDRGRLARALLKLDPNSLVHGTFLESISGVLRLPRALSGFVEARDVRVIESGGVKNDRVKASKGDEGATAKEGFGNVPFHRDEYAAREIVAYFNLDLALLRSYQLGQSALTFLYALSLWKLQRFLAEGLRLRTACDLDVTELRVTRPAGVSLPGLADLEQTISTSVQDLRAAGKLGASPTVVNFMPPEKGKATKNKKGKAGEEDGQA